MSFHGLLAHFFLLLPDVPHFIYLLMDLGLFPLWAVNGPGVISILGLLQICCYEHTCICFCLDIYVSFLLAIFLGVPFPSHMVPLFSLRRAWETVLQSRGTILPSHQQWVWAPFYPHPCQHMWSLVRSLVRAILVGVKWFLTVILIRVYYLVTFFYGILFLSSRRPNHIMYSIIMS